MPKRGNDLVADGSGDWLSFHETRELQSNSGARNMDDFQEAFGDEIPDLP